MRFDGTTSTPERVPRAGRVDVASLLEVLAVPTVVVDVPGRIVGTSPALDRWLGYEQGELLGVSVDTLVPESSREVHRGLREELVAAGATTMRRHERELPVRRRDGSSVRARIAFGSLPSDAGTCVLVTLLPEDAPSEAKATREELERERERLRQLIATAPGSFCAFRMRSDGFATCPYASPSIEDIYGVPPSVLAEDATIARERTHPDDRDRVRDAIARSAATLEPWHMEYRVDHPTRGTLWVEGHSMPSPEPDGSMIWYGFLRDITDRRAAEDELRTSRAKLESALEAGGMGTWELDLATMRLSWDDRMYAIWGFSPGDDVDLRFDTIFSYIHPDDRARMREATEKLLATAGRSTVEYRVNLPNGGERWLEARNEVALDPLGKPARLFGIQMDITEKKRAEEASLRSRTLEALGTLAGGIAHDFNNILLAILGYAGLAAGEIPRDHPMQQSLAEIQRAGLRAAELVRSILAFGRPHATRHEALDLRPVVTEALRLLRASLPAMTAIRSRFAEDLPDVGADAHQVHSAVVNLVTNAAHAIGGDPGTIEVVLEAVDVTADAALRVPGLHEGRYACLRVTDDGCGMDAATLERAFDPFFTTKPVGKGTGLGLSVVHGIVSAHGGAISAESTPGKGSTFRLYFPAADGGVGPMATPRNGTIVAEGAGRRILFVDDESVLVDLGVRSLRRLGYEVTGTTDPLEALGLFRSDPSSFDAVVTDLSMPRLSGLELSRALLRLRPDVPIVLASGHVEPEHRDLAELLGIRAVLEKPAAASRVGPVLRDIFAAKS